MYFHQLSLQERIDEAIRLGLRLLHQSFEGFAMTNYFCTMGTVK